MAQAGEWAQVGLRLPPRSPVWATEAFRDELVGWAAGEVGEVLRAERVKLRPWSTVWRVEAVAGVFYAKQSCELQSSETGLAALLADLDPHRVVAVAATDERRGFLLTPDHGRPLRETAEEDDLEGWGRVLRSAAELQRDLVPHVDALREVGLATIAPGDAPSYVAQRLDSFAALPPEHPMRPDADTVAAVAARLPAVQEWADEVEALGLPLTLNHNDLHDNNVFHVGAELRFFDFGDALVTEPLGVLLIPLDMLGRRLGAGPDDPRLVALVEPVLEVWSDLVPLAELRAALPAALRLGRLGRLETWLRCCPSMTDTELAEWGPAVADWLGTLALDPPLARLPG
ncbi:hypothetical protein [Nocardioides taihuensis]|uniref:Aminoglycoside phosphotransferase domain-containing protein n=1 Tax=Nocardioides taihuensis TaxID=1835606 RepID=A0ABW0BLH4_9ACTN